MTLRLSSVQDQPLKTDIPTAESNLMVSKEIILESAFHFFNLKNGCKITLYIY